MTKESAGFVALTSGLVTVFLLVIGAGIWRNAPTPAEEAVGKGILTLAGAAAIIMFCSMTVYLDKLNEARLRAPQAQAPQGRDWYADDEPT
jgi:hypothetical protein